MTLAQEATVLSWHEPSGPALRGTLVVLPGRGESPRVYDRFGLRLATDSYRVHAVTAPGDDPDRARDELLGVLEAADADAPRVVVGSDAGAAYAAHLAASGQLDGVAALVLAGLPTGSAAQPARDWDEELAVRTACGTHRGRISEAGVRRAALFADLPADWFDPATPGKLHLPVLGLHGRNDLLSPVVEARRWYASAPSAELVTIVGGLHDALNDQTHRTVAAVVVQFLERLRGGAGLAPIAVAEPLDELVTRGETGA
ncbi:MULTISPECIES: alpha/beta hydrolase [Pseudofrankia]|uniref:alpha/beta hydrolase n=1 Tax=Pseudofrankia TaxID=2994363 RepID=UPI000234BEFB|nr:MULTISPECIES: alpha/beta fold hydrolase [Pseudofrankia]OHV36125.1 lysophospholipase [Pseudofrankia sp. EUN1h]